jgi:hypothetical protein
MKNLTPFEVNVNQCCNRGVPSSTHHPFRKINNLLVDTYLNSYDFMVGTFDIIFDGAHP